MAAPAVIAAIAAAKALGSGIGAHGAYNDVQRGATAFNNLASAGRDTLTKGKEGSTEAYKPYTDAGKQGVAGLTSAVGSYKQDASAGMPTQQTTTAQGTQAWLDPSAAYSMDQSNKAIQASALAKGGVGGGLAKALSNNASKMAMTNWNTAYNQQLNANNQNFNQGQQLWQNNKSVQDSNIANLQGLTNVGLQGTQANQGNQLAYNQSINSNYIDNAKNAQEAWNTKAGIFDKGVNRTVSAAIPGISAIFGK